MVALPTELPQPGTVLAGKYRLQRVLGQGVMGVVYEAVHERLGQRVAIKLPQLAILSQPILAERFEREARASARLRHRNSVRVMDVDVTEDGLPYLVMELLEGRDLESEMGSRGPLPVGEAVGLVIQACAAMQEAHSRGIVHRDLKPSNMFLANEADGTVCLKVLDFGISKFDSEKVRLTATQHQMGTPLYMSPEQVRSVKDVDGRTDVWSLGVILYELLSGLPPFTGSVTGVGVAIVSDVPMSLRELRPEVPDALEAVIGKAMSKAPSDRFASMHQMILALAPFSTLPLPAEMNRMSMISYADASPSAMSTIPASAISATLNATTSGAARLIHSAGVHKTRVGVVFGTLLALAILVLFTSRNRSGATADGTRDQLDIRSSSFAADGAPTPAPSTARSAMGAPFAAPASAVLPDLAPAADRPPSTARPRSGQTPPAAGKSPSARASGRSAIKTSDQVKKSWDTDSPFPPP